MAFDRTFREPKAVRAAADWSGPVLDNRFVLGVQGIVSNGLSQQGAVDINVARTPRFTLHDESGRPVYADPATIVPSTGAIAAGAARVSSAFQTVLIERSDLGMRSRQFTVNLKPVTASGRLKWDLSYSRTRVREQYYGFASTAGDPFAKAWGASLITPDHSVSLRWSDFPVFDLVYVTLAVQAMSGQRYTPAIANDVNGDGVPNDRAFIANPATIGDDRRRDYACVDVIPAPHRIEVDTCVSRAPVRPPRNAWELRNTVDLREWNAAQAQSAEARDPQARDDHAHGRQSTRPRRPCAPRHG
ncbi:MAG TPA: hypothetical protein VK636_23665 [Gemmatimonadaceae bacterium]|nr:hypothetical protein [Gemmatimonadaceae bacterium]